MGVAVLLGVVGFDLIDLTVEAHWIVPVKVAINMQ